MPTREIPEDLQLDDAPRGNAPRPRLWREHVFRSQLSAPELEQYYRQLDAEFPPETPVESVGCVPGYEEMEEVLWQPDFYPGQFFIFTNLMKGAYYALDAVGKILGNKKRRPAHRPLRVLRMTSLIAQGGVAKVCLQSTLPTPPERVEYHLFAFGKKTLPPPELTARPHLRVLIRKILLWPSSYRLLVFRSVFRLARLLWKIRPDLIHLHEPQFAPTVRMAAVLAGGIPVCVQLHNDYTIRRRSIHPWALPMTLHALRRSHLIACSRTIQRAAEIWLGTTQYPITLIMDGNDDIIETPITDDLPERLERAAGGRLVVSMMANLLPHKRVDDFLCGCRILLDEGFPIYVLLMAYGKEGVGRRTRRRFNRLFEPHEGEFLPNVPQAPRMLGKVAIGVSTSAVEGLGLNILEYQAAGVPVVCSNMMPHREMVTDGETGLLFEGLYVPDFVRKMRLLLNDEALRRRLGEAGRLSAQGRRWANTAAATCDFYASIFRP
jgi:glycosyltransferase involved in cell wall biosynthesis